MNLQIQLGRAQRFLRLCFLVEETTRLNTPKGDQQEAKQRFADLIKEMQTPPGRVDQAEGDWKPLISYCRADLCPGHAQILKTAVPYLAGNKSGWHEDSLPWVQGQREGCKRVFRAQGPESSDLEGEDLSRLRLDAQSQELRSQNDQGHNNRDRASLQMHHTQQRSGCDCSVFCVAAMVGCRGPVDQDEISR